VEDVFRPALLLRAVLLLGLFVCFIFVLVFSGDDDDDDDDELGLISWSLFPAGLKHWLDGIGW